MDKLSDGELYVYRRALVLAPNDVGDVRSMATELLELREQVRWIPVSERLPDHGDSVLVYFGNVTSAFLRDDGWWRSAAILSRIYSTVTHWQPLPPAPEVE